MKCLVSATNLHSGGAVTVAASFIEALAELRLSGNLELWPDIEVVASTRVYAELSGQDTERAFGYGCFTVLDSHPGALRPVFRKGQNFDAVYTIFGPDNFRYSTDAYVVGFADGSLMWKSHSHQGLMQKVRRRVKLQRLRDASGYVVQTSRMEDALSEYLGVRSRTIIVPNGPHPLFGVLPNSRIPRTPATTYTPRLFYPARGYPHKNHKMIPSVLDELQRRWDIDATVVTTLNDEEFATSGLATDVRVLNVGELTLRECLFEYSCSDALFFPSLLETSSATPLEALSLGIPVIMSELPDSPATLDFVWSFPPGNVTAAAASIAECMFSGPERRYRIEMGRQWVQRLPTEKEKVTAVLDFMMQLVLETEKKL